MDNLKTGNLEIKVRSDAAVGMLEVWLQGTSDARHPGLVLDPYFQTLLEETAAAGREIEMHFENVDFYNSSTIGSIVQLVRTARAKKVKLTLFYNGKYRWQEVSFNAIRNFETNDGLINFRAA